MIINKAVITAAGKAQRTLPLQTLIDRDGTEKSVLSIIIEEVLRAGVEEICIVVRPGDEIAYVEVAGDHASRLHFVHQTCLKVTSLGIFVPFTAPNLIKIAKINWIIS